MSNYLDLLILSPFYERETFTTALKELKIIFNKDENNIFYRCRRSYWKIYNRFREKFNSITIICIEPHPTNMSMLSKAIKANDLINVVPINVACAASNGHTKLWISTKSDSHSLVKPLQSNKYITVPKRSIDSIISELKIDNIDLIKIDVEGAEYDVIKGALKTIEKHKPLIIVEIKAENYNTIIHVLRTLGYSVTRIEGNNYIARSIRN